MIHSNVLPTNKTNNKEESVESVLSVKWMGIILCSVVYINYRQELM